VQELSIHIASWFKTKVFRMREIKDPAAPATNILV
jgi:hypothetical protein